MSAKIIALAISTLAMSGCVLGNNSRGEGQKPPAIVQFTDPVVPAKIKVNPVKNQGIPSTTQNRSVPSLVKTRRDPFAQIIQVPQPIPKKVSPLPSVVKSNNTSSSKKPLVIPQAELEITDKKPIKPSLPKLPDTKLAHSILVSGVILVNQQAQAIIKLPDDLNSRYVQAGERLANGVLVKRIEVNLCNNPVVVLEQFGVEVRKVISAQDNGSELC
ncbi:hypothetical protein CEP10_09405 [Cylindrospermopsis raciborskii S07]|uniref:Pilus assembly protein PilP n=1 Tax=Cylindrospermopsis raciborskii C07 TaxID=2014886 RepID=A0ABX4WKU9_9CYAN|nr:hypothetical protein [Cylindrospermopsis raciborskii]OHY43391.1 hypothetical protein BCV63_00335 [Cylindrospermopsis raciborskii CS-508]PNJ92951.1 hypothetical protein CEP13_13765 [Cylindrospermopsis raciborskii C03]PNJ96499.1 hypothetical protein CEP15_10370 [Cylindrospermopsis raciborskii C07]PNJ98550.1 hypothetical protein CEP14_04015 [Cylindrospermopsis raciborskii C04]PNK06945.1 hypothetical protein CEP12_08495 [Cylindrospermopsis raciborskii S14]